MFSIPSSNTFVIAGLKCLPYSLVPFFALFFTVTFLGSNAKIITGVCQYGQPLSFLPIPHSLRKEGNVSNQSMVSLISTLIGPKLALL